MLIANAKTLSSLGNGVAHIRMLLLPIITSKLVWLRYGSSLAWFVVKEEGCRMF